MEKTVSNCSDEIKDAAEVLISAALNFSKNPDDSMTFNARDIIFHGVKTSDWEIIVRRVPN